MKFQYEVSHFQYWMVGTRPRSGFNEKRNYEKRTDGWWKNLHFSRDNKKMGTNFNIFQISNFQFLCTRNTPFSFSFFWHIIKVCPWCLQNKIYLPMFVECTTLMKGMIKNYPCSFIGEMYLARKWNIFMRSHCRCIFYYNFAFNHKISINFFSFPYISFYTKLW